MVTGEGGENIDSSTPVPLLSVCPLYQEPTTDTITLDRR